MTAVGALCVHARTRPAASTMGVRVRWARCAVAGLAAHRSWHSASWFGWRHDFTSTLVEITIIHGSLGTAEYPLMIGGFADEQLGGQERFIDRQFAGLLSSWEEVGLFPTKVGSSRFIELNPDVETEPPGCYVIGLGSVVDVQREQLTFSVRQALVDRCIRLYREPLAADVDVDRGLVEVGVSSSLMGVRSDRGLRVEDSVAGIVEGVLQANQALALYESSRAEEGRVVRITALEFLERFAEQANLAAVALRSLSTAVHLPSSYDSLRKVTVTERPGGLPLGATLTDVAQGWRRFVITAADVGDSVGGSRGQRGCRRGRSLRHVRHRPARSRGARRSSAAPARQDDGRRARRSSRRRHQ